MKAKEIRRKIIINMLSSVVIIATLAGCSFAWVGMNKQFYSNGLEMQVKTKTGVIISNCQVYKRDGMSGAINVTEEEHLELTEYDTVFPDKNVDTPIILRVELSQIPSSNPTLAFDLTCSGTWTTDGTASGKLAKHLSNIVEIRFGFCHEVDDLFDPNDTSKNATQIFDTAYAELQENFSGLRFAKVSKSGSTYTNVEKTNVISSDEISGYESNDGKLVIYVAICYAEDLVAAYLNQNDFAEGGDTLSEMIDFPNDMGRITFDYVSR